MNSQTDTDLAMVKELHDLRMENAALQKQRRNALRLTRLLSPLHNPTSYRLIRAIVRALNGANP